MEEILNPIYSTVLTLGIGVVGFFVKRSFDSIDTKAGKDEVKKAVEDIKALREELEEKSPYGEVQRLADDIKNFRREYATKEELKEIRSQMNEVKASVEFLKENAVRKSDFVWVTADITSKIDDLSSYLRGKL